MNKWYAEFKRLTWKRKLHLFWKILLWVPAVVAIVIMAIMVGIFNLNIQSGLDAFKEIFN